MVPHRRLILLATHCHVRPRELTSVGRDNV